jgi:hypothetical protein
MNSIKFMMALAAMCMLVMPAFSMGDSGMGQDCKQKMWQGQDDDQVSCDCQKPCDCKEPCGCQKSIKGQDDHQMCQGHDDKQKECGCKKSMMGLDDKCKMCQGHDDDQKSCGCQKSMMGQDNKQMWQGKEKSCDCQKPCDCNGPCDCSESMKCQDDVQMWHGQDDKHKECGCQKSMVGPDEEQKMCFGQDGRQKECGCHESMMGPEGKHIKSMMRQDCNPTAHKIVKSMMGDRDGNGMVRKIVVVKR